MDTLIDILAGLIVFVPFILIIAVICKFCIKYLLGKKTKKGEKKDAQRVHGNQAETDDQN